MLHRLFILAGAMLLLTVGPGGRAAAANAAPLDYADPAHWLCRPGRADPCAGPVASTVIRMGAAMSMSKQSYSADPNAPIDCFYVYPTVSSQPAGNSDGTAGAEEIRVAKIQFARFGAVCRLFAPLYRQTTMAALRGDVKGGDPALAYADVLAAWKTYLARDNGGRGVVLIGHSQGAKIVKRLLHEQIDGRPLQARLVSAIDTGAEIAVPSGQAVGGDFAHIPLCASADAFGCLIAYSSFLASAPPGPDARFGGDPASGQVDACVNPAALLGRRTLQPAFPAIGRLAEMFGTDLIENPDLVSARCARTGDHSYLAITVGEGGDLLQTQLTALQARLPAWGLHVLDVNLTLGDLVEIVGRQSVAWRAANPGAQKP